MSEIKRVTLSTFEPQKVSDKGGKKTSKTIRISVVLPESNEDNCPEYNYKDQLADVKRRSKQSKESNNQENGVDPFGDEDNDNDVRRIALEMEAKYGSGMIGPKKKRKGRKDDYADIGMGYDETDSFIDNTDGYDEIIPQNVTTLHGGFYINCGALEFKTDDEASSEISSSASESEEEQKGTNRKRILDTTDESESDTASTSQIEKKPKLQSSKNTMQQAIKKKLFSQNKIQVKKRRLIDPVNKTVKELLRVKREDLNMSIPTELKPESEDNMEKDSLKENKKPMSITSVTDAIESVVKQTVGVDLDRNQNKQNDVNKICDLATTKTDAPSSLEGESSQEANKGKKVELVKLPENLPPDISDIINNIKQAALDYKGEGKKKFFTPEVNTLLLNLERKCKILGKSSRVKVYEHLAYFIKCRKETLIKRAKNLVLEDEEKRLKKLTSKLKNNVDQIMPSLIANYEQESQRILQQKFLQDNIDSEDNKALKMPRRRFQWTEETRKLLKDILSVKKRCLLLEGKQKDNLEDQISQFLRTLVLPLWPEGWMYLNALKKVYNTMTDSRTPENNNAKLNTQKHSSLTIMPVSNNKGTGKAEIVPNDLTLSKINNGDVRSVQKPIEIASTSSQSSYVNVHNYSNPVIPLPPQVTKSNAIHTNNSSSIRENDKPKHEKERSIRENEKPKHEKERSIRENEKPKHEKERDFIVSVALDCSKTSKEIEIKPPPTDTGVIVINTHKEEKKHLPHEDKKEFNTVIPKPAHCQVIDVTDISDLKRKAMTVEENRPFKLVKETSGSDIIKSNSRDLFVEAKKIPSKHPDLNVMASFLPSTPKVPSKSEGDDIQMVMENLKALQKLSSPIKNENSTGSPVSVIAYNRSFSPKSNSSQSSGGHRTDYNKSEFAGGFQDEFQKQFINSLQQMATTQNSTKQNYNRCS